jgi:hypothetical protein
VVVVVVEAGRMVVVMEAVVPLSLMRTFTDMLRLWIITMAGRPPSLGLAHKHIRARVRVRVAVVVVLGGREGIRLGHLLVFIVIKGNEGGRLRA